jgi:16S rRNA (adenine1518-N6/adenine1519-N6)-dimethyltransferase
MKISQIKNIINTYKLHPNKKYGQNFLIDENICNKIIEHAGISPEDNVMEIGPGLGSLTIYLVEKAKNVTAVEIDSGFVTYLQDTFHEGKNFTLLHNDFLKLEPSVQDKIISNLPYYCSSEILFKIATEYATKEIYIMLQKEMAERLVSTAGTENYGAMTVSLSFYFNSSILFDIGKTCFYPAPDVTSSFLKLTRKKNLLLNQNEIDLFHRLVKAAFWGRRKTLYKTFLKSPHLDIEKNKIDELFEELGINRNIRGEELSADEFVKISSILSKKAK